MLKKKNIPQIETSSNKKILYLQKGGEPSRSLCHSKYEHNDN